MNEKLKEMIGNRLDSEKILAEEKNILTDVDEKAGKRLDAGGIRALCGGLRENASIMRSMSGSGEEFSKMAECADDALSDAAWNAFSFRAEEYFPPDPKKLDPNLPKEFEITDIRELSEMTGCDGAWLSERFKNRRIGKKGIFRYGYRMLFDKESGSFTAKDVHIADVEVKKERNVPRAYVFFSPDADKVFFTERHVKTCIGKDGRAGIIVPAWRLEGLLYGAGCEMAGERFDGIPAERIRISPDSVRAWYEFEDAEGRMRRFCNLTDSMSKDYAVARGDLIRHELNLESQTNGWGLCFVTWDCHLIENGAYGVYLDESITGEEVDFATKYCDYSGFAKDVRKQYAVMCDGDGGREVIEKFTEKVEVLQKVIDDNADEIVRTMKRMAGLPEDASDEEVAKREMSYGFDCGFSYFHFEDPEDAELARDASLYDCMKSDHAGRFSIRVPYVTQSTTMQSYENTAIARLAKKAGISVGFSTRLD